jgi:hypothetical protein
MFRTCRVCPLRGTGTKPVTVKLIGNAFLSTRHFHVDGNRNRHAKTR